MRAKNFLILLIAATVAPAAHIDCAFVPTIGDMVALGSHGCRLDDPHTGFSQYDFSYTAQSMAGNPVPDPFSLGSSYFGGHDVIGLSASAGDTLNVTLGYTWNTGTDLISLMSARIMSTELLPAPTSLRTEICIGAAFAGNSCSGELAMLTSSSTGADPELRHVFSNLPPAGGILGFRHFLTLPGGADGQAYDFNSSGVLIRAEVPEPGTLSMSCLAFLGLFLASRRARSRSYRSVR